MREEGGRGGREGDLGGERSIRRGRGRERG